MPDHVDLARLQRLIGGQALVRLRQRLARKLLNNSGPRLTLSQATEAERTAVERLVGRPPGRGRSLVVDLAAMERALERAGVAPSLRAALEALDGPLVDWRAEREADRRGWDELVAQYRAQAEAIGLGEWLDALQVSGLLKRVAERDKQRACELLDAALRVLARLPGQGISLSALAAECLGDAHALDVGEPVAALVRRALARYWRGGVPLAQPDERSIWAHAGVLLGGDITSAVLVHRLPTQGGKPLDDALAIHYREAEPTWLTLRQLLRDPPAWACAGRDVYVCENPSILAEAAERLGARCAPLIVTWGRPGAAVLTVLEQLEAAGAVLHYRGDFDWPGIGIANSLFLRFTMKPWRMGAADLAAFSQLKGKPLEGQPVDANWDPALRDVLVRREEALHEEQLLSLLLADLQERQL